MEGWKAAVASADGALIERAVDGDTEAFGELFDAYGAAVLRYFQVRSASFGVAADLCAETFAAALESLDRYHPAAGTPAAWLYGIARNKYLHWLRSVEVERRASHRLRIHLPLPHCDDLDLVDLRADLAALIGPLEVGLARLSDGTRRAVELRIMDELPYEEVARQLGCSSGAARLRVARGLDALLTHLGTGLEDT